MTTGNPANPTATPIAQSRVNAIPLTSDVGNSNSGNARTLSASPSTLEQEAPRNFSHTAFVQQHKVVT